MASSKQNRIYWFKNDGQMIYNILSEFEKTEKHSVIDLYKDFLKKNETNESKYTQGKKLKKRKKKDIIIDINMKKMSLKKELIDNTQLNVILKNNHIFSLGLENVKKFITDRYKILYKFELLKKYVKESKKGNKNTFKILDLYLQLHELSENDANTKLIKKISRQFEDVAYRFYTIKFLSDSLPPLDFYNMSKPSLEDWQIEIIDYINTNNSVLIEAPTSSGKTWMSIYSVHRKLQKNGITLYLVPSNALSLQVAGLFRKILGNCVSILNSDRTLYPGDTKVIVATVNEAETHMYKFYDKIDFVIYDEIHNLNDQYIGTALENIIKTFRHCNFLALSATINNSDELISWWRKNSDMTIKLVKYKNRFINLQRCQFNFDTADIVDIHPMTCLTKENLIENNIPFTPYDMAVLYETMENEFEYDDIESVDPDVIIKNERPTLNDTRQYEFTLKKGLYNLNKQYPDKVDKIFDQFKKIPSISEKDIDLSSFSQQLKSKDMLPAILFNYSSNTCVKMYNDLVNGLIDKEKLLYPFHYDNLLNRKTYIDDYMKNCVKFKASMKMASSKGKRIDKINIITELEEKTRCFENNETKQYLNKLANDHQNQVKKINENTKVVLRDIQLKNLKNEFIKMTNISAVPKYIDIYQKHKNFCFTYHNPMTEDEIRNIRRELKKTIGVTISYNNLFIQGLKYGVGLYVDGINEIYKLIVQRLCQNNKLYIVIADKELTQGINLPFRTSVMVGYNGYNKFNQLFYQQGAGRSGRRGKDKKGFLCHINIDWTELMNGKLSNLVGNKPNEQILSMYPLLKYLNPNIINDVSLNMLNNPDFKYDKSNGFVYDDIYDMYLPLMWKMRQYGWNRVKKYINYLNNSVIHYKYDNFNQTHEIKLIHEINDILYDFNIDNLVKDYKTMLYSHEIHELGNTIKHTYNQLIGSNEIDRYSKVLKLYKQIFNNLVVNQNKCSLSN